MRTKSVQAEDVRLNVVSELYLRGYAMRDIAKQLKEKHEISVTHVTVFKDVKALREQWKVERMEAYETGLATELEKLDRVEVAAWEGWERSLREGNKRTKTKGDAVFEINTYEADSAGDPRFLAIITKVSEQRSRLLGLFKSEPKEPDDQPGQAGQLPAPFTDAPTFVIVGGSKEMIEREDDLPED